MAEVEHAAAAARLHARCAQPCGTAESLLADTRADLATLRHTLGDRHPVTVGAADAVAARVHRYAAGLAARALASGAGYESPGYEEVRRARGYLVEALAVAASPRARRPIADHLADLAEAELVARCRRAVHDARRVPSEAAVRAEALLRAARPLLGQLREWRTGGRGCAAAADEVAAAVFLVLTEYVAATGDVATARGALRQAVLVAATAPLRRRLMSVL